MTNTTLDPAITESRRIAASPRELFAILSDPSKHALIDGSGMVGECLDGEVITTVGAQFTMAMHNDEMGPYEMTNHVVSFESGRRIAWEPVLTKASRDEDQEGIDDPAHHYWGYSLEPVGPDATEVTEFFDCSRSPEWLKKVLRDGERWREAMSLSLEKLDKLATAG